MLNGIVTGALWKVSHNAENVDRLEDLGIVPTLIKVNLKSCIVVIVLRFSSIYSSALICILWMYFYYSF